MIKTDHHMHTDASLDSSSSIEDMIKQAIKIGLTEICITDHTDFALIDDVNNWGLNDKQKSWVKPLANGKTCEITKIEFDQYIDNYKRLAALYKNKITVLMGTEIGLCNASYNAIITHAAKYPFDFIIASQHSAAKYDICLNREAYFLNRCKGDAYASHLEEVIRNIRTFDCFDVLGHLDYIIRYAPFKDRDMHVHKFDDQLRLLLRTLVEKGKGIEINTSGFRYGLGRAHPSIEILQLFRKLGGEIITIGSDAHKPEDIGSHFTKAKEILHAAGFKAYTKFAQRKPTFVILK